MSCRSRAIVSTCCLSASTADRSTKRCSSCPRESLTSPVSRLSCARLAEEVGAKAERLTELGHFLNSPGYCDELTTCFLAEGLEVGARNADGIEEEHLVVERISLSSVDELIATGDIADAKTIVGLLLARLSLEVPRPGPDPLG